MKSKLLKATAVIAIAIAGINLITQIPAYADSVCDDAKVSAEIKKAAGCNGNGSLESTITGILNAVIAVAGLVSVVYIVIGGINYITSTGDAGKIQKAKTTILYALIGLIICAFAFIIVNWVIVSLIGGAGR